MNQRERLSNTIRCWIERQRDAAKTEVERAVIAKLHRDFCGNFSDALAGRPPTVLVTTPAPIPAEDICDHVDCDGETRGSFYERPEVVTDMVRCPWHAPRRERD